MQSLSAFFEGQQGRDIYALAQYIQSDVNERWQGVLEATKTEMVAYYPQYSDSVYNLYTKRFFSPLKLELKQAGLQATPKLPGNLNISREWGPETERQRWIWSKIIQADKSALGTILVIFYHTHNQIDLPRPMEIVVWNKRLPKPCRMPSQNDQ